MLSDTASCQRCLKTKIPKISFVWLLTADGKGERLGDDAFLRYDSTGTIVNSFIMSKITKLQNGFLITKISH